MLVDGELIEVNNEQTNLIAFFQSGVVQLLPQLPFH